jgi:hypothetical protein
VIHDRRSTVRDYLRQQRGYGEGEGLLFRKYPLRSAEEGGLYAGGSWTGSILGGARVYYGAFGRGLFQTVYSSGSQYAELPLTIQWIAISTILLLLGVGNPTFGIVGGVGLAITFSIAFLVAISTPLSRPRAGVIARTYLFAATLLGPSIRSLARERVKWRIEPASNAKKSKSASAFSGAIKLVPENSGTPVEISAVLGAIRGAFFRHGLAVATTDGFQAFDLEVIAPPMIRIPINALADKDGSVTILRRLRMAPRNALIAAVIALVVLLAGGLSLSAAIMVVLIAAIALGGIALVRAARISAIVTSGVVEAARNLEMRIRRDSDTGN